jgi:hypothetical protein
MNFLKFITSTVQNECCATLLPKNIPQKDRKQLFLFLYKRILHSSKKDAG